MDIFGSAGFFLEEVTLIFAFRYHTVRRSSDGDNN